MWSPRSSFLAADISLSGLGSKNVVFFFAVTFSASLLLSIHFPFVLSLYGSVHCSLRVSSVIWVCVPHSHDSIQLPSAPETGLGFVVVFSWNVGS